MYCTAQVGAGTDFPAVQLPLTPGTTASASAAGYHAAMSSRFRNRLRIIGAVGAAVLLLAAVVFALRAVDPATLASARADHLVLLAVMVVGNLAITGVLFWSITRCFDTSPTVGPGRMIHLIAASALLNYVPLLRPGLVGRTAYLKAYHALPVRQSVAIFFIATALAIATSVGALIALLPLALLWRWGAAIVALATGSAVTAPLVEWTLQRSATGAWLWLPLRTVDLLLTAARLWLAFQIAGEAVTYETAIVMAAASLLIKLVGLTPNGLGLSEWAIAGLAGLLAPIATADGILAALVDRTIEVLIVVPAGMFAAWHLRQRQTTPS